jgi:hypothetical protein
MIRKGVTPMISALRVDGLDEDRDDDEVLDLVDIEEFGKAGKRPPKAKRYRIRIDKIKYDVDVPWMTGSQLLQLAGKTPVERYSISQKLHGGQSQPIGLDDIADFRADGVERYMTLPLDQTEG